jgi:hypothetical protein
MFSLPPTVGQDLEGSMDSAPLRLEGISKEDFVALLGVMYPPYAANMFKTLIYGAKGLCSKLHLDDSCYDDGPKSKWISILKLATLWMFKELRAGAIWRLNLRTSPFERVLLAKQYNVPQWLRSGYEALVRRTEMLSLEEARQLGYQSAFLVCQAREEWAGARKSRLGRRGSQVISDAIDRVFKEELVACTKYTDENFEFLVDTDSD